MNLESAQKMLHAQALAQEGSKVYASPENNPVWHDSCNARAYMRLHYSPLTENLDRKVFKLGSYGEITKGRR